MKLSTDDLKTLHEIAVTAATEAGELIASYANKAVTVQHKNGGDSLASQVVTEIDLLSEQTILKYLRPSCEQFGLALLTEESRDDGSRLEMDHFWCIDPLDGTLAFIESIPGYAVSIALVSRDGKPLIGVVFDPVSNTLLSSIQGQGVMRNGLAWSPVLTAAMQGKYLTLVCDQGLLQRNDYPNIRQALEAACDSLGLIGIQTLEKGGGAVMNACWAIDNQPACYFKLPKKEVGGGCLWDFAATAAIYSELGAFATDFYGQPLDLNRADSTFMNHRGVLFVSHLALASNIRELLQPDKYQPVIAG